MHKSESKTVISELSSLGRRQNDLKFLINSMHEGKSSKKHLPASIPLSPRNYPVLATSFVDKPAPSPKKVYTQKIKMKSSNLSRVKERERIRRVPPPNFMTGVRDLHKVYERDYRFDDSVRRVHNLSSIY